ncbi:MAG: site-2 protease family protein [Opitutales bacterium]
MDLGIDLANLREGLILYLVLVVSLSIHEWAHAFVANKLGDHTPAALGRVTLNPVAHMDLFGTVIFPLACIFLFPGGILFGWGKPVMINPSNFANRKRGEVLTTMAGPAANLGLALLAAVLGGLALKADPRTFELFRLMLTLNVVLAVFNLLPIPPLDGGTLMKHAIGMSDELYLRIAQWSWLVLLVAINLQSVRYLLSVLISVVSTPFVWVFQLVAG